MWAILREIGVYICFVWILFVMSYSNHDINSFNQVKHLRNFFLNIGHSNYDYTQVKKTPKFFFSK